MSGAKPRARGGFWLAVVLLLLAAVGIPGTTRAQEVDEPLYIPAMVVSEANFRGDPSTKNAPLDTFQAGKQVLILGRVQDNQQRDWYLVRVYDDGREGYIFGNLLRPLPAFTSPPSGMGTVQVTDEAEKARLVGRHGLTLQLIGNEPQGEVVVFEDLGLIYLTGWQQGQSSGDSLQIEGWVWKVEATSFRFSGTITYSVATVTGQTNCSRSGDYIFSRPANRTYWRLETTVSPCGKWDQLIDIHLRK